MRAAVDELADLPAAAAEPGALDAQVLEALDLGASSPRRRASAAPAASTVRRGRAGGRRCRRARSRPSRRRGRGCRSACPLCGWSGKPLRSMRESGGYGLGHEPVVQMCPQKWKASASSGLTAAATAEPPATASAAAPRRPRNERRVVDSASLAESFSACRSSVDARRSGGCMHPGPPVSRSDSSSSSVFTVPLAATTPSTRWTTNGVARHVPARERVLLQLLLDDAQRRAPGGRAPRRRRSAGGRGGRWRRRRRRPRSRRPRRPSSAGAAWPSCGPSSASSKRHARADPERQHADLAVEGEDEQRQQDDRAREEDEHDGDDGVGGGGDVERSRRRRPGARAP